MYQLLYKPLWRVLAYRSDLAGAISAYIGQPRFANEFALRHQYNLGPFEFELACQRVLAASPIQLRATESPLTRDLSRFLVHLAAMSTQQKDAHYDSL